MNIFFQWILTGLRKKERKKEVGTTRSGPEVGMKTGCMSLSGVMYP